MKNQSIREKLVLIVEDDFDLLWMIQKLLTLSGFQCLTAVTAAQGVEAFSRHFEEIGAVVLDLSLPDQSGELLAKEFLELSPQLPIIVTTGFEDREQRRTLEEMGIFAYLIKPFDLTQLVDTLKSTYSSTAP
ncbi:MAG TPA: response regulator [Calditrichae bacterium]|nr:response regulator [Calditrichia bacterium]